MKKISKLFWVILTILTVGGAIDVFILVKQSAEDKAINSFEACVARNNMINLMYPAQCRTKDGRVFTQPLTDEEKAKLKPPAEQICQNKCGNGVCEEIVCLGTGCPCAETYESCFNDCAPTAQTGQGILYGKVNIGPFCPVERPDVPCPVPPEAYSSRKVMVYQVDGKTLVTTTVIRPDGSFSVPLSAGKYTVNIAGANGPFGQSQPQTINIISDETTVVEFNIDTGIR